MMNSFILELESNAGLIEIVPFFDVHIGDPQCNIDLLKRWIEYVGETPNAYAILGGDLINNTIKNSVGDVYAEGIPPMKQIDMVVELFTPIKDKVLVCMEGNHEYRSAKEVGLSPTQVICAKMGIGERYSPDVAYLFITTEYRKKHFVTYTIFTSHGFASSSNIGGKMSALEKMSHVVDANVYLCGHTHDVGAFHKDFIISDVKNKKLKQATRLFVNANSFLGYGGYGMKKMYVPTTAKVPKITLNIERYFKKGSKTEVIYKVCEATI